MNPFGWFGRSGRTTPAPRSAEVARPRPRPTPDAAGQRLREPERPQDSVLSAIGRQWRAALPARNRPDHLCTMYPRVANRLALCWGDPALSSKVLDDLVVDRRRGRAGFPPDVSQELIRLRLLRPVPPTPSNFAPLWDASNMACGDR